MSFRTGPRGSARRGLLVVDLLIESGAVDEYRLQIFPTAPDASRRLFPDGRHLELVSTERMGLTTLAICTPGV